jgi:hypothetical protein
MGRRGHREHPRAGGVPRVGGCGVRAWPRTLDVDHETLRFGVDALHLERATAGGPVSTDERAELALLRRRVAELELEAIATRPWSSARGRRGDERGQVFGFIAVEKATHGLRRLCRVLRISKKAGGVQVRPRRR